MIPLGNFIVLCIGIILYLIWSYFSIRKLITMGIGACDFFSTYSYVLLHVIILLISIAGLIIYYSCELIEYLNQYTIP